MARRPAFFREIPLLFLGNFDAFSRYFLGIIYSRYSCCASANSTMNLSTRLLAVSFSFAECGRLIYAAW